MDYPIICILGDRGDGKTLTARALADMYAKDGKDIIANFDMYEIKYRKAGIKGAIKHFPELYDTVLIFDEIGTATDAYQFWKKEVVAFTDFLTQLRKRRIVMILTIQRYKRMAPRLRDMIDYFFQVHKVDSALAGEIKIDVFNAKEIPPDDFIQTKILHGKKYFDLYDTNELIKSDDPFWGEVRIMHRAEEMKRREEELKRPIVLPPEPEEKKKTKKK